MEQDSESSHEEHQPFQQDHQANSQIGQGNKANSEGEVVLSKKQRKKLIKKEKWEKEKLQRRKQQRQREKEKKKLKKQQQHKLQDPNLEQTVKAQKQQENMLMRKRKEDYHDKMAEGLKVIIDLQFYDLMTEKEQNSLIKQLSHCHSINRKSQKCFNYILTSATTQRQEVFANRYNADKWGIQMYQQNLTQVFPKEKLVYLTGDAEEDIEQFDSQLIYIIGGIVDHNRLKKITYNYAIENEIAVRRLPMKSVKLKASVHLAVNHVWQWMLRSYNGAGWDQALKAVLPLRKLQNYNEE